MATKLGRLTLKFIWEHFTVLVICTSTLTLPWQPNFDSHVFQNLHFFLKNKFYFFFY